MALVTSSKFLSQAQFGVKSIYRKLLMSSTIYINVLIFFNVRKGNREMYLPTKSYNAIALVFKFLTHCEKTGLQTMYV